MRQDSKQSHIAPCLFPTETADLPAFSFTALFRLRHPSASLRLIKGSCLEQNCLTDVCSPNNSTFPSKHSKI